MQQPIGDLIDSLGVTHNPAGGELASAALVLIKVVSPDGLVSLRMAWSDGLSFIERAGMLAIATRQDLDDAVSDSTDF